MKKFKFYDVIPLYVDNTAFVVDTIRRHHREIGLDRVALCLSMHPQGTPATVQAGIKLAAYRKIREALANESDLDIGILVQSTLGHGWSGSQQLSDEPWQRIVTQDGTITSRMCPSDERFRHYVLDIIGELAATRPAFLLMDDDFDARLGECYCPTHLAALSKATGTQFKTAQKASAALVACAPSDPLIWTWQDHRVDDIRRFAREIRETIDRHDPSIRCGYCTPYFGFMYAEEIAKLLAGGTEPFVRFANTYYLDTSTQALPAMAGINIKARDTVSSIEEVLDESDTFPHTRYSESARALHAHLTSAILGGLTGSKLWISDFTRPNPKACQEYERIVAKNRRFYDALLTAVDGIQWQGFLQPLPAIKRNYNPRTPLSLLRQTDYATSLLARYGIPFTYERSNRKAPRMLCSVNVDTFTDEDLLEFLKGGLLLDTEAAEKLQVRGFARYMGCTVEKDEKGLHTHEVIVDSGITLRFVGAHNIRRIMPTSPETHVITWLHRGDTPTDANRYSPGATCFVNEFGARVVVAAFSPHQPSHILLANGRREVLLTILKALNGGTLPLWVDETQDVCVRYGQMTDGTLLLAIFNANFDPLEGIPLCSPTPIAAAQRLGSDGAWHDITVVSEGEGRYRLDARLEIAVPGIFRLV